MSPTVTRAAEPCAVGQTLYVNMSDPQFTAGFRAIPKYEGWLTALALYVHSANTDRTLWFLLDQGNSTRMRLVSTTDIDAVGWMPPGADAGTRPLGDLDFLAANAEFQFFYELPKENKDAPEYVLIPALTDVLWYANEPRERAPLAFFKLSDCRE